jgi:hypothetical protein
MLERVKSAGQTAGGLIVMLFMMAMPFVALWAFFKGAEWLVVNALDWIVLVAWLVFAIDLLVLLPMAIFRRLRPYSANGLLISSYVFGATTWFYGFIFTYGLWGGFAVVVGLFMLGVGVVFMGMLATAFKGMWDACATLLVMTVLTFGVRYFAIWLGERGESAEAQRVLDSNSANFT